MERRKTSAMKSSPVPSDYTKMVGDVFSANFDEGLKELKKLKGTFARFEVNGAIFPAEVVLAVSLLIGKELAATTVYASVDYDPRASVPQIQDLLSVCVDAIGTVFGPLLAKEEIAKVAEQSLSALKGVPFEWTAVTVERQKIFVMIDKSNPNLDQLAD